MTVYKSGTGSVYQSWCEGGPDGSVYAANKSGYFDMDKFQQWFKEVGVECRHNSCCKFWGCYVVILLYENSWEYNVVIRAVFKV